MNRCPNCAAQNREGAKFCTSCGFRLPSEQVPVITNERSPFATTSTVPPHIEEVPQPPVAPEIPAEPGFATWNPEPAPPTGPGYSWDAAPPQNTAVPVDDEMIARGSFQPGRHRIVEHERGETGAKAWKIGMIEFPAFDLLQQRRERAEINGCRAAEHGRLGAGRQ